MIQAYAVKQPGAGLERIDYDPGPLGSDQVEIDVIACGICHSDLSMVNSEWGEVVYPLVPGHEVVSTIAQRGANVQHLAIGERVGLGWFSGSCRVCNQCLSGNHNLCPSREQTIVGRHGGFADKVRCQAEWAMPLPEGIDIRKAGPLFCGGITVFNPLLQFDVRPTHRVGVIGIGGLGHLALQFLNKWGCEVTAFTSSDAKRDEVMQMGAHHAVNSYDASQLDKLAGSFDFILSTVAVDLDWEAWFALLAPKGRLHIVGAAPSPIPAPAMTLIGNQRSLSGTPAGSPFVIRTMLDFCARHRIEPVVEYFPMSQVNEALARLAAGKARYRIVLENDLD